MRNKILVIGGVAAGTSAASQAKKSSPDAEVTIIQQESEVSYGSCGMPYVIEGLVNDFDNLIVRSAQEFREKYGINVITDTKAIKIVPRQKRVYAVHKNENGEKESNFDYDKLIIATGARAVVPPIKGIGQDGIFVLRTISDGKKLKEHTKNAKSCILIGAGLVGLEMAEAYKTQGLEVSVVEMTDRLLPRMLDERLSKIVEEHLVDKGVMLHLGERVQEILTDNENGKKIIRTDKREIKGDFVLVGVGVRPNTEIAKDAGIELGVSNAIMVDEKMRTNLPDIYAAGDCATARNYVTGKDSYLPLGTTANKQGKIAGRNAVENDSLSFEGIAGSAITKVFDLFVGSTGLSLQEAKDEGFDAIDQMIEGHTRAGYYPGGKSIWINLVAERKSGRLLGAQIVGGEFVKGRIDQVALALFLKANIKDIANYDWCYVPPVSPVWDPISIAASQLAKKIEK